MIKYILILILLLCFCGACTAAEAPRFDPWDFSVVSAGDALLSDTGRSLSMPGRLLWHGVKGFRGTIGAVDGDRCRMAPTCSVYSLQAIETHGFIMGILMTVDRLLHEMDEMELAPVVMVHGEARFSDPVSANDFWWNKTGPLDKQSFMGNLATQEQ
jgi:hypothetical protein